MSLFGGCSKKAFGKNIGKGIRSGRPQNQAVAIAYSERRRTCKDRRRWI